MISFEPTITFGAILQTLVLMGGIVGGWIKVKSDITSIKSDIKSLENSSEGFGIALSQLSTVLTQVAVQDNRLLNVEKRIDELAHGKGFIQ
jgi:hypothetical protein